MKPGLKPNKREFEQRVEQRLLPALQKQKILVFPEVEKIMGTRGARASSLTTGWMSDFRRKGLIDFEMLQRGHRGHYCLVVPKLRAVVRWAQVSRSGHLSKGGNALLRAADQIHEKEGAGRKNPSALIRRDEAEILINAGLVTHVPDGPGKSLAVLTSPGNIVRVRPCKNFDDAVHLLNRALLLGKVRPSQGITRQR